LKYKSESKPRTQKKLWRRHLLTGVQIEYACGTVFQGSFKKGLRQGEGSLRLPFGDNYEGTFCSGFRDGVGKMTYYSMQEAELIVFEGDFEKDQRHGYGTLIGSDGNEYHGHWEFGMQTYGTFSGKNGEKYLGYWKGGKIDKKGIFQDKFGVVYKGQLNESRKTGQGVLIQGDTIIKGEFNNNKINKKGTIKTKEFEYTGEILQDKPHGYGIRKMNNNIYEGMWVNGLEEGKGTLDLVNKDRYVGEFKGGFIEGLGVYTTSNGEIYDGHFIKGKKEGEGSIQYSTQMKEEYITYKGSWKGDLPHGKGRFVYNNGSVYEGEVNYGKITGFGHMILKEMMIDDGSTKVYTGEFIDGRFDGKGKLTINNEVIYDGYWKDGKRHGEGIYIGRNIYARTEEETMIRRKGLFCKDKLIKQLS